jgi:hypothetical protein
MVESLKKIRGRGVHLCEHRGCIREVEGGQIECKLRRTAREDRSTVGERRLGMLTGKTK